MNQETAENIVRLLIGDEVSGFDRTYAQYLTKSTLVLYGNIILGELKIRANLIGHCSKQDLYCFFSNDPKNVDDVTNASLTFIFTFNVWQRVELKIAKMSKYGLPIVYPLADMWLEINSRNNTIDFAPIIAILSVATISKLRWTAPRDVTFLFD